MKLVVTSFDFCVEKEGAETFGKSNGVTTKYQLPIEGLMHLVITKDDGTVVEESIECNGWMIGDQFELSGRFFISPRVVFKCKATEDVPEEFERIEFVAPNVLFGFNLEKYFSENMGVN